LILNLNGVIGVNVPLITQRTVATPAPIHAHIVANTGIIAQNAKRGNSIKLPKQTKNLNEKYLTQGRKL